MNNLEAYALEGESLSKRLRGERLALLDWLEDRYGGKRYGAAEDLTAGDAAALANLVRARRDTLSELIRVDDSMLVRLLQRLATIHHGAF